MENNNITLSDVERNKELFEYEMTEVILQLKGEFAKVSGKDLHLDSVQFDTKKLNIQSEIPEISVSPIEIETNETANNISVGISVLPEVKVTNSEINCPTVPVLVSVSLDSVQLEWTKPDCPAVKPVNEIKIEEIKLNVLSVPESVQKLYLADLPEVTVSSISVNQVDTKINIPDAIKKIQLNPEKIEVSAATVNIPEQTDIHIERFALEKPAINKISLPESYDTVSVSVRKIDIPDTVISVPETEDISIELITPDIPERNAIVCYKPVKTEILLFSENQVTEFRKIKINADIRTDVHISLSENVSVPKISEYNPVSLQNTSEKFSGLAEIPDIIPFQKITMTTVSLNEKKSVVNKVYVPVIPKETTGEIKINVNHLDIESEYPKVDVVNISSVTVQKTNRVIIPEEVDFSSYIRDILESAV